jgi:hypothetical protein
LSSSSHLDGRKAISWWHILSSEEQEEFSRISILDNCGGQENNFLADKLVNFREQEDSFLSSTLVHSGGQEVQVLYDNLVCSRGQEDRFFIDHVEFSGV